MTNLFSTKMYHGSDLKLDILKPTAYNAGHYLKKHSWSVFMWPTYNLAYKWAVFVTIRNIIRVYENKDPSIHCPRGIHKSTGFNSYDFEMFMVNENYNFICDKCVGAKAYVYTVDCPIDMNFGIGNNNAQPEYTYDGELEISHRNEIVITRKVIDSLIEQVSLDEYNERTAQFGKENIRGLLGLVFYPIKEPMHRWRYVYRRIDLKEVKPGDDLDEVMSKYGDDEEMDRVKTAHRLFRTQLLKEGYEQTMEKTVTYGEELAPKNMNHFKIRENKKDMSHEYMDPEEIYNPPKNFYNLDQISGLELQTFKGFRKLDDDIKMIFHSGSDYNCIGYIRCPETGIQLTKKRMPEASGRIERYDYYIKDSKGHGGKFELWFNPDRHYASEAALVLEASAHGEEISMQDVKRKIRFVEGDKGTMNSVYEMNGKQYRVRVETLVVRNLHGEPHIFFQKKDTPSSYGQMYKLPGGSVEPNKDWATQASAECNEEILTKVKNIRYTGVSYIKEYPPGKTPSWQRASVLYQKGVDYTGAITFVFVAEYDGPYKKYVHAIDRDSLAKEGKWYPVKDFNHLCNDEHKGIIYGVKLVSDEPSADVMTEGFQPIEEVSVVKKIVGKIFGKDKQPAKERQMSAERLKRRKDVVNHTFDVVGKFLAKTLKNPEFARCFTKDESMLRKWEQGGGKYTTVLYWDKKRFKGSDEEWNKCYKAFRREVSMHRTDVKGFSIGCARGSNSSNGLIQLTDHSKLWRPLNEVFVTQEDYSLMGSLPKKKIHRKVVSRHAMNGKNKVKIVSQEQQYPDWF